MEERHGWYPNMSTFGHVMFHGTARAGVPNLGCPHPLGVRDGISGGATKSGLCP